MGYCMTAGGLQRHKMELERRLLYFVNSYPVPYEIDYRDGRLTGIWSATWIQPSPVFGTGAAALQRECTKESLGIMTWTNRLSEAAYSTLDLSDAHAPRRQHTSVPRCS